MCVSVKVPEEAHSETCQNKPEPKYKECFIHQIYLATTRSLVTGFTVFQSRQQNSTT